MATMMLPHNLEILQADTGLTPNELKIIRIHECAQVFGLPINKTVCDDVYQCIVDANKTLFDPQKNYQKALVRDVRQDIN